MIRAEFEDGRPAVTRQVAQGQTVQFLKLMLAEEAGKELGELDLLYQGDVLIDPFSICDCIPADVLATGEATITVALR